MDIFFHPALGRMACILAGECVCCSVHAVIVTLVTDWFLGPYTGARPPARAHQSQLPSERTTFDEHILRAHIRALMLWGGSPLRPLPDWHGVVGQTEIVRFLRKQVRGAKLLGRPLEPMIFGGGSGLGKTTLACALAKELGSKAHTLLGGRGLDLVQLAEQIEALEAGDLIFADEAHGLPDATQEAFYGIWDRKKAPRLERNDKRRVKAYVKGEIDCPEVSLVFGTDQPGRLKSALKKRCLVVTLRPYTEAEMRLIVRKRAVEEKMLLTPQAQGELAGVSQGIPRTAGLLLKAMHNAYAESGLREFRVDHVRRFLMSGGIDQVGRTADQQRYMDSLGQAGERGLSLQSLALRLQCDTRYVEGDIEPWLAARGWVEIRSSGRYLTPEGRAVMAPLKSGGQT